MSCGEYSHQDNPSLWGLQINHQGPLSVPLQHTYLSMYCFRFHQHILECHTNKVYPPRVGCCGLIELEVVVLADGHVINVSNVFKSIVPTFSLMMMSSWMIVTYLPAWYLSPTMVPWSQTHLVSQGMWSYPSD